MSGCQCHPRYWHDNCACGCSEDDTECRASGCCGVEYPPHLRPKEKDD